MFVNFLANHKTRIVNDLYGQIRSKVHRYSEENVNALQENVFKAATSFLEVLESDSLLPMEGFLDDLLSSRTVEEFPLAALHQAFTVFSELLVPLLHEYHGVDTTAILQDFVHLQGLISAILNTLVAQYEARSRQLVWQQQEQLRDYGARLEVQLVQVGEEFHTLQEFNESILQSMTSGLLVADKATHRIRKFNRAMERLSGWSATDVLGRTVEEIFADVQGLSFTAFAEEVEQQGSIAFRKHRLSTPLRGEFYRSIKGEVFYDHKGQDQGVIVIVDDVSEMEILRDTFSRYLSQQVMEQVLSSADLRSLQSTRREVSVLFADIRSFTTFAEQRPPEEVVEVLNQYFDSMVQVLFAHQGTLDKFLGDGLLAMFGTPLSQPDHPHRAVQAALAMQQALAELNSARLQRGQLALHIGIGINSGEAIVGNIGSEKRMEYTVVGDMVNVAQRLQAQAGGGDILIGANTFSCIRNQVKVYEVLDTQVKGRQQAVRAYRIGPLS